MNRIPFKSSNIKSAGYDPEQKVLEVEYHGSGGVYQYQGVTPEQWECLNTAPSAGAYMNKAIKPGCPYEKVEPEKEKNDEA